MEFESDSDAISACKIYRAVRITDEDTEESHVSLAERMEKVTGKSGRGMFTREGGLRMMASIVAEVSIKQHWNLWFMLEGAPGQSERALFTDPFAAPMLETDYLTYARAGTTFKF
jgi:hypothetical protein